MRKIKSEEDVLNEVRTAHKDIRRRFFRLAKLGIVLPYDPAYLAFTQWDLRMYDVEAHLVEILFASLQLSLFEQKESASEDAPSEGGLSE